MTCELEFDRVPPKSGFVRKMVVFLHGYGADGADLLGLAAVSYTLLDVYKRQRQYEEW